MKTPPTPDLCYLCGLPIEQGTGNMDHIPPRHFFAPEIRRQVNLRLVTRATHVECNSSYRSDEEYFGATMPPMAAKTLAGRAMIDAMFDRNARGGYLGLTKKVISELDPHPSGLHLPDNLVVKRVDAERAYRVVWKIIRGLYFVQHGTVLPESTPRHLEIIGPLDEPHQMYRPVLLSQQMGEYPAVFAHKNTLCDHEDTVLDVWALLFWDGVLAFGLYVVDKDRLPEYVPVMGEMVL